MLLEIRQIIKIFGFAFIVCFFVNAYPALAETPDASQEQTVDASSPEGVVSNFYTQLLATMANGDTLGFNGRFEKLAPVLLETFDFKTMTRLAAGSAWNTVSENEQQDLVKAFAAFSTANYASRFPSSSDGSFTITGVKKIKDNVVVETILEPVKGESVQLNYLMHKNDNGQFRVIDVLMGGVISELAGKRSEFSSIIKSVGVSGLIDMLNEKVEEMKNS
ncbi:MAG: ABC transporter substrate-binding protein [Alphaproteobacteria bacterium]|nr:ABC transporter substrate-binding protein [Alphaproteobacteria bacterium]